MLQSFERTLELSDEEIRSLKWYYEVELRPDVFTQGSRFINMLPTRELMNRVNFSGLRVLDIGTMEGAFSMMLARAGASVTGYDRVNMLNRIDIVKSIYDVEIDYRAGDAFHKFAEKTRRSGEDNFDAVIFSGVLYHTIEPGLFLYNVRSLLKPGGIMVFETACVIDRDAALFFNERGRFFQFTNYYQPSTAWIDYYLRILGFQIVDVEFVDPMRPIHDGKHVSRVAMTCILSGDSIIEDDDIWGGKRLALKELREFAAFHVDQATDLSGRISPGTYSPDLFYKNTPKQSLKLNDVLQAKPAIARDQSKCVMRLDDRLG
jgi:SAM-dependent methyltransferase